MAEEKKDLSLQKAIETGLERPESTIKLINPTPAGLTEVSGDIKKIMTYGQEVADQVALNQRKGRMRVGVPCDKRVGDYDVTYGDNGRTYVRKHDDALAVGVSPSQYVEPDKGQQPIEVRFSLPEGATGADIYREVPRPTIVDSRQLSWYKRLWNRMMGLWKRVRPAWCR